MDAGLGRLLPNHISGIRIPWNLHFKHTVDFLVDLEEVFKSVFLCSDIFILIKNRHIPLSLLLLPNTSGIVL